MAVKYIILDTNCFLYALKSDNSVFDFDAINKYAKENDAYIIITAYTLYELIQDLNSVESIRDFRNELIYYGDFWIVNVNHILSHENLEYGLDYIFLMNFQSDDYLLAFAKSRKELSKKVYQSLYRKMFLYSVLVASLYLAISTCDENGEYDYDTLWRIKYLNRDYFNKYYDRYQMVFSGYYEHLGYKSYDIDKKECCKDFDARKNLRHIILNLIIEELAVSKVVLDIAKTGNEIDDSEYNRRIIEQCYILSKQITINSFHKSYLKCLKRTNNRISVASLLESMASDIQDSLEKRRDRKSVV